MSARAWSWAIPSCERRSLERRTWRSKESLFLVYHCVHWWSEVEQVREKWVWEEQCTTGDVTRSKSDCSEEGGSEGAIAWIWCKCAQRAAPRNISRTSETDEKTDALRILFSLPQLCHSHNKGDETSLPSGAILHRHKKSRFSFWTDNTVYCVFDYQCGAKVSIPKHCF